MCGKTIWITFNVAHLNDLICCLEIQSFALNKWPIDDDADDIDDKDYVVGINDDHQNCIINGMTASVEIVWILPLVVRQLIAFKSIPSRQTT